MLVTVEAHHSKGEHFRDAICGDGAINNLSETHCLIGKTTLEIPEGYPNSAVCEDTFHAFNWMTKGRNGAAPKEINDRAREFDSHASMSVGDIVVIHRGANTSIYQCRSYSWRLIIEFQTDTAGIPEV
jgi:hypothetical protein